MDQEDNEDHLNLEKPSSQKISILDVAKQLQLKNPIQKRQSVLFTQELEQSPLALVRNKKKNKKYDVDEILEENDDDDDFFQQKQKLIHEVVKFEKMDKFAPINNNVIQKHKQQSAVNQNNIVKQHIERFSINRNYHPIYTDGAKFTQNNETEQQLDEFKQNGENALDNKEQKIIDGQKQGEYVDHHFYRQGLVDLEKRNPNQLIEFNADDFQYLQKTKQKQLKNVDQDLQEVNFKENKEKFELNEALNEKWIKVKRKLRMIGKMKLVFDEVKLYGTSFRVESSSKRNEVIQELETILQQRVNMIEKNSEKKLKCKMGCLIHPDSNLIFGWTFVLLFLFFYTAFITPIRIVFVDYQTLEWLIIEWIIDVLFFIDVILNFNSAYYTENGELVTDRKKITFNYLRTWFVLDILAIFPFQYIFPSANEQNSQNLNGVEDYFKLTKLPRLYRLIRVARIVKMFKKMKKNKYAEALEDSLNFNAGVIRVVIFFFTVVICVHIMGCFWYYAAKIKNFEPQTWVYEHGYADSDSYTIYMASIYWTVTTISTVGFGDIRAYNDLERLLSIVWMIFGAGFYSFTVGSLASILASLDTKNSHLFNKITVTDEFCFETGLSKDIRDKIRGALEYAAMKNIFSQKDRDEFLSEIPSKQMYQGLRAQVPFFKDKEPLFIAQFVPLLQPLQVSMGEVLFQRGQHPNLIYFLTRGRVNMVIGIHQVAFKTYVSGSHFGEVEIFDSSPRLHTARAETDCDMLTITQTEFIQILSFFPDYFHQVKKLSLEKLKKENEAIMKMQNISNISYNSKFWEKSRQLNLYQAVKERKEVEYQSDADSQHSHFSKASKISKNSQLSKNWLNLRKKLAEKSSLGMLPHDYKHSLIPHEAENPSKDRSVLLYSENLSLPSRKGRRDSKYMEVRVSQFKEKKQEQPPKEEKEGQDKEVERYSTRHLDVPKAANIHMKKHEVVEKENEITLLRAALQEIRSQLNKQIIKKKSMVSIQTQTDDLIILDNVENKKEKEKEEQKNGKEKKESKEEEKLKEKEKEKEKNLNLQNSQFLQEDKEKELNLQNSQFLQLDINQPQSSREQGVSEHQQKSFVSESKECQDNTKIRKSIGNKVIQFNLIQPSKTKPVQQKLNDLMHSSNHEPSSGSDLSI